MKLSSGFCIPEPLPLHTGIKGRQVHPLIRSLLRSRVDENVLDEKSPQSLSSLFCSWLASRCSQRSPSHQRFPWALRLKEHSKRANHGRSRLFQDAVPSMSSWFPVCGWRTQALFSVSGRSWMTHAPVVGVWAWLRCDLVCAATHSGLSGLSRRPPAGALEDLRVTVRASSPGTSPRTSYFSCVERPV